MGTIELLSAGVSIAAVVLFACYPEEAYYQSERAILLAKLVVVNAYCWVVAVMLYLGLLWSFRKMGIPAPPFRFTPIWKRQ